MPAKHIRAGVRRLERLVKQGKIRIVGVDYNDGIVTISIIGSAPHTLGKEFQFRIECCMKDFPFKRPDVYILSDIIHPNLRKGFPLSWTSYFDEGAFPHLDWLAEKLNDLIERPDFDHAYFHGDLLVDQESYERLLTQ